MKSTNKNVSPGKYSTKNTNSGTDNNKSTVKDKSVIEVSPDVLKCISDKDPLYRSAIRVGVEMGLIQKSQGD